MQKCLVTGSRGFIGRHFVKRLRELHYDPVSADDLLFNNSQSTELEELGPLRLFHFAGAVGVSESWAEPARFIESNVFGTARVLELCSRTGGQMVFLSSPIENEDKKSLKVQKNSANPYLLSKRLAEQLCEFFEHSFDVNVVLLRLSNVYGPGQSSRFLIPQLINQLLDHDGVSVQNLSPIRDYVYIDDVIDALTLILDQDASFSGVFNVGTGIGTSVEALVKMLGDIHSRPYQVECQQTKEAEKVLSSIADVSIIKSALNWESKVLLRDGLEKTYIHLKRNKNNLSE